MPTAPRGTKATAGRDHQQGPPFHDGHNDSPTREARRTGALEILEFATTAPIDHVRRTLALAERLIADDTPAGERQPRVVDTRPPEPPRRGVPSTPRNSGSSRAGRTQPRPNGQRSNRKKPALRSGRATNPGTHSGPEAARAATRPQPAHARTDDPAGPGKADRAEVRTTATAPRHYVTAPRTRAPKSWKRPQEVAYESVVDFSANGATRGQLHPVRARGEIVRPRAAPPAETRSPKPFYAGEDGNTLLLQPPAHRKRWTEAQWIAFEKAKRAAEQARKEAPIGPRP